jgi:hypothetical protein
MWYVLTQTSGVSGGVSLNADETPFWQVKMDKGLNILWNN